MKLPNVSHFLSLSFAVMLLLSAGVQPVMAADAAKKQLDSFSFNDMNAIAIDEMRSDSASGSISFSSLSVDEDLLEFQQGKIHIRAKDPMADLHSSDAGEYSASSAGTTDPVDVRIAIVIANLSREGYVPLGNTEHQYLVTIESDKFRNLQGTQQALLKSQGLQVNSGGNASISALGKTNYFFFTNLTTNINRTVVAEQMVKNDGSPIGSMKVVVLEELAESYNDQMRGMEVSGSGYISASSADDKKMPLEEDHFWRNWGWGAAVAAVGFGILIVATGPVAIVVGGLICTAGISYLYYLSLTSSNPTITPTSTIPVPPPDSTVISFGDTSTLTKWPSGTDYSRLGGSSAIRRDGSLDTFVGAVALSGTDWVQATYGAAINKEGTLVTWTPGSSAISTTYLATADKKYVAVSRFSEGDWLLAITEDAAGETHLELVIEGDKTKHPEISDQLPTGTGWMKISAGNNHALALKSDRNLVAWGKNTYKQLELPADKKYTDIAAGRDFSLGLVETGTSTDTGPDLMVVAKGWDDDGQVRDMQALPVGRYITIEAGTTRSAAVDHDGTIRRGGKAWTGSQLPQGNGYTDIALGPDYGFALKEAADEIILSGPISPGKPTDGRKRGSTSNDAPLIPLGSTIEHSDHDVTRIFGPDGTQLSWVNDKEAQQILVPYTTGLPVSRVFSVPSEAVVNQSSRQTIVVNDPTKEIPVIFVKNDASNVGVNTPSLYGIYYLDYGGTAATVIDENMFVAPSVQKESGEPGKNSSSYKYMWRNFGGNNGMGILCDGEGTAFRCTGSSLSTAEGMPIVKRGVPQSENLNFSVIPITSNLREQSNTQLNLNTETSAYIEGNNIHYSFIATSSQILPEINITPMIFTEAMENRSLVYMGDSVRCYNDKWCSVSGTITLDKSGNYFSHGIIQFTVPDSFTVSGNPRNYYLIPDSEYLHFQQPESRGISCISEVPVKQIEGNDLYLWGLESQYQSCDKPGKDNPVNIIIYNTNRQNFISDLKKKTVNNDHKWFTDWGSDGNGLSGKSLDDISWKTVNFNDYQHLVRGDSVNTDPKVGRYHCPIFEGGHSDTLGADWIFSFCHHEYWVWNGLDSTHVQTGTAANEGKAALEADLLANSMIDSVIKDENYGNKVGDYFDGIARFMKRI